MIPGMTWRVSPFERGPGDDATGHYVSKLQVTIGNGGYCHKRD
jgi:hypothetical protein